MATSPDVTLRTACVTSAFCAIVSALYAAVAAQPSPIVVLFLSLAPSTAVCVWLQKDARHTGVGSMQDWGFFLWLFWPVLIPWYAFTTRGIPGWRLAAGLLGLVCAPYMAADALGWWLYA